MKEQKATRNVTFHARITVWY